MPTYLLLLIVVPMFSLFGQVKVGIDMFFEGGHDRALVGKKIGLITNITAIDAQGVTTLERLKTHNIVAVFAPEHGYWGSAHAAETIHDDKHGDIPIYSLHGSSRRPSKEQLSNVDVLIYDIQDIGSRSYTYISTLFYCMEEAVKYKIPFIVLDRPNPLGGMVVDGPLVDEASRSFIGYINIPYCHGMTVGELANYFNQEYSVGCNLSVISMEGWHRRMTFNETGLNWIPTSPQIPEADTAFFYPTTGLIGHYSICNIGVGYTLPFKVIGAPWIDAEKLAEALNRQKLSGVHFQPFFFRPFFGKYQHETCNGVLIIITEPGNFYPISSQYTIMGVIKSLYPQNFAEAIAEIHSSSNKKETCQKLNGCKEIHDILTDEKYVIWKLREICQKDREKFLPIRAKYLIPTYN